MAGRVNTQNSSQGSRKGNRKAAARGNQHDRRPWQSPGSSYRRGKIKDISHSYHRILVVVAAPEQFQLDRRAVRGGEERHAPPVVDDAARAAALGPEEV